MLKEVKSDQNIIILHHHYFIRLTETKETHFQQILLLEKQMNSFASYAAEAGDRCHVNHSEIRPAAEVKLSLVSEGFFLGAQ